MNDKDLKFLWQTTHDQWEKSLIINKKNMEEITRLKARNFLSSMKPVKIFTLISGILWVGILGIIIFHLFINAYDRISLFFLYSASFQVLLTSIAVVMYMVQLDLIYTTDFSGSVLDIQKKLLKLQSSSLNVARILFLQLPAWTTFYWNDTMLASGNIFFWILQGLITLSAIYGAFWLFSNIKYENRNKKWFQWIFSGNEWLPIIQALEHIKQIEEYQKEEPKSIL
ncbi:MAG TPA: hypothetical protein PKC30_06280 [Saprospiraceae bacterium]|nr:hypothetical protein [Saprospiraceae bacterium]